MQCPREVCGLSVRFYAFFWTRFILTKLYINETYSDWKFQLEKWKKFVKYTRRAHPPSAAKFCCLGTSRTLLQDQIYDIDPFYSVLQSLILILLCILYCAFDRKRLRLIRLRSSRYTWSKYRSNIVSSSFCCIAMTYSFFTYINKKSVTDAAAQKRQA